MLVVTLITSGGVLWYLGSTSSRIARESSLQDIRTAAEQAFRGNETDQQIQAAWSQHQLDIRRLPNALADATSLGDTSTPPQFGAANSFEDRAVAALSRTPRDPYFESVRGAQGWHIRYALSDQQGGMIVIEKDEAFAFRAMSEHLARLFIFFGIGLAVCILGVGVLFHALDRVLLGVATMEPGKRREIAAQALLQREQHKTKNQLPAIVALALLIFLFDLRFPTVTLGVAYVGPVLLSLNSTKRWHTHGASIFATVLVFAKLFIAPVAGQPWLPVVNALLAMVAIWTNRCLVYRISPAPRLRQAHACKRKPVNESAPKYVRHWSDSISPPTARALASGIATSPPDICKPTIFFGASSIGHAICH